MLNYPDPFIHPNAYYWLTVNDRKLSLYQKRKMLEAVGMAYGQEPAKSKAELEREAA